MHASDKGHMGVQVRTRVSANGQTKVVLAGSCSYIVANRG
jgi:hypothetical protein